MADAPLLRCDGLRKEFDAVVAVDDLDLAVYDEFTSLIGPNGAGKTTAFNLLSGVYPPTDGRIWFRDEEITNLDTDERVHRGLTRTFQVTNLFTDLSAFENVRLAVQAVNETPYWNVFADALDDEAVNAQTRAVLDRIGFEEDRTTRAADLSQGYKRLLEIGIALAGDPDLLLMDEPTAGLAVDKKELVLDVLGDLADDHAVLLIEHKLDVIRDLSDRLLVMHNGRLLAEGDPMEVLNDDQVQEAYMSGAQL